MAKDKQLDIVRDLVLGLVPKLDRRKTVEELAKDVGRMYRVIFREVRDVEYEEFAGLVLPAPVEQPVRSNRAGNYLVSDGKGGKRLRGSLSAVDAKGVQGAGAAASTKDEERSAPKPRGRSIQGRIKGQNGAGRRVGLRVWSQSLDRRS